MYKNNIGSSLISFDTLGDLCSGRCYFLAQILALVAGAVIATIPVVGITLNLIL